MMSCIPCLKQRYYSEAGKCIFGIYCTVFLHSQTVGYVINKNMSMSFSNNYVKESIPRPKVILDRMALKLLSCKFGEDS